MNPIGIKCLQDLKKINGFENAIIAGGMVRDFIMKGSFTDIDIFVPITDFGHFENLVNRIYQEKNTFTNLKYSKAPKSYGLKTKNFYKVDGKYLGNIDIDIVGIIYHSNKEINFGDKVLSSFNYAIDQFYFNGEEIIATKEASNDIDRHRATLLGCDSAQELPSHIAKFLKLQKKYPDIKFHTDLILLDPKKDVPFKDERPQENWKKKYEDLIKSFATLTPNLTATQWATLTNTTNI